MLYQAHTTSQVNWKRVSNTWSGRGPTQTQYHHYHHYHQYHHYHSEIQIITRDDENIPIVESLHALLIVLIKRPYMNNSPSGWPMLHQQEVPNQTSEGMQWSPEGME